MSLLTEKCFYAFWWVSQVHGHYNVNIPCWHQNLFHSLIFVFAIVTSGISIYNKIQASDKARYTEPDINDNGQVPSSDTIEDTSLFHRIFQCFDVIDNYNRLFQLSSSNSFLSSIAGMRLINSSGILWCGWECWMFPFICRTVICIWTIAFHINYHSAFTLDNIPQLTIKMEYFLYQPIFQAYLYVDVFFVLRCEICFYFAFEHLFSSWYIIFPHFKRHFTVVQFPEERRYKEVDCVQ